MKNGLAAYELELVEGVAVEGRVGAAALPEHLLPEAWLPLRVRAEEEHAPGEEVRRRVVPLPISSMLIAALPLESDRVL